MQEGEKRNGEKWFKQEYILEVPGQYPKKVCFSLWGDKIGECSLRENDKVTAHIDVESREYNSRWYTEIKAWKVEKEGNASPSQGNQQRASDPVPAGMESNDDGSDLPF
jgi:hypothetical protein